ncbi:DNA polymerase [Aureimonas sp. Leaf454]|nr:DNA polymerase [Aureimonas sp. Leaf454]
MADTARDALGALLDWYASAGVDALLEEAPRDRFAETAAELEARRPALRHAEKAGDDRGPASPPRNAAPPPLPAPAVPSTRTVVPDDVAVADARERARAAGTLDELQAALSSFESCNLRRSAKSLVFGDGSATASVMMIGEAPDREEDIAGEAFAGRSGGLLDRMLAAIGLERPAVRLATALPWRPPGGRQPTPAEIEICLPFLARHIELVRPRAVVSFGALSARMLLRADGNILRLRGRWQSYAFGLDPGEAVDVLPMFHPTYLLQHPAQKRLAWEDLQRLRSRLDEKG